MAHIFLDECRISNSKLLYYGIILYLYVVGPVYTLAKLVCQGRKLNFLLLFMFHLKDFKINLIFCFAPYDRRMIEVWKWKTLDRFTIFWTIYSLFHSGWHTNDVYFMLTKFHKHEKTCVNATIIDVIIKDTHFYLAFILMFLVDKIRIFVFFVCYTSTSIYS